MTPDVLEPDQWTGQLRRRLASPTTSSAMAAGLVHRRRAVALRGWSTAAPAGRVRASTRQRSNGPDPMPTRGATASSDALSGGDSCLTTVPRAASRISPRPSSCATGKISSIRAATGLTEGEVITVVECTVLGPNWPPRTKVDSLGITPSAPPRTANFPLLRGRKFDCLRGSGETVRGMTQRQGRRTAGQNRRAFGIPRTSASVP